MALISCPDCGTEISDQASACIKCGRPMLRAAEPVTIQQTAKPYKGMQFIGVILILVGVVSCTAALNSADSSGAVFAVLLFIAGLMLYILGRVGGWWHHG